MMTRTGAVYKCEQCGNIVEVLDEGAGQLACCGQPMSLMAENTADASQEKHVPVVEKTGGGIKVRVGSVGHPMTPEHHIEWIEAVAGGRVFRKFLATDDKPEAEFSIVADSFEGRAYCNLHGLWKD
jgi:superoxide reductase